MGKAAVVAPGDRYGNLVVLGIAAERHPKHRLYNVRCDCGKELIAVGYAMRAGKKLSCGCRKKRPRHDLRKSLLWDTGWLREQYVVKGLGLATIADQADCSTPGVLKALTRAGIETRSPGVHLVRHGHAFVDKNTTTYRCWIGMKTRCYNPNWKHFKHYGGRGIIVCDRWLNSFENFLADMGAKPEGLSIDRIDVNGNYEPGNCRWATQSEQIRNRRPRQNPS